MTCSSCGRPLAAGDSFCGDCGAPVSGPVGQELASKGEQPMGQIGKLRFFRNGNTIWARGPGGAHAIGEFTQGDTRITVRVNGAGQSRLAKDLMSELSRFASTDKWGKSQT